MVKDGSVLRLSSCLDGHVDYKEYKLTKSTATPNRKLKGTRYRPNRKLKGTRYRPIDIIYSDFY